MDCVVLDKCYLQGASRKDLDALRQRRNLVMTGALFYELLDTSGQQRKRCFGKLPPGSNPVVLVDNIADLLRYEIAHQRPCGKPSEHALQIQFQFNPALLRDGYELPEVARTAMREEAKVLSKDAERLVDLSETADSLFQPLLEGSDDDRRDRLAAAHEIIADPEWVIKFYSQFVSPEPTVSFPDAAIIGPSWAHIRYLQVQLLFTVDLYVRYQGKLREQLNDGVRERMEHDLHDAQGLALGVLEGCFATREKKLAKWFKLLLPEGKLIQ